MMIQWAPVLLIVFSVVFSALLGLIYSTRHTDQTIAAVNKRIDDLRSDINARFEDLIRSMETRFKAVEGRLDRIETRLDRLEHPVAR